MPRLEMKVHPIGSGEELLPPDERCLYGRAARREAIQNAVKSGMHTRWKRQPLRLPKARTVRVVTPPEPQAGPPLLDADVHPITGFDESESALSPKRGRTESIAPPK